MLNGVLTNKQSFFSLNLYPSFDKRHWVFKGNDGSKEKIASSWRDKPASRCPKCGLLVLPPRRPKPPAAVDRRRP